MRITRLFACVLAFASLASCSTVPPPAPASSATAAQPFVVAANPLAARAGIEVLNRGGSAIDAAIAIQAMLSLVEPQSSGIGGGAFITHYSASTMRIAVYDGRETAPAQASESMFLDSAGKPLPFGEAVLSGRATGVPGVLSALNMAHEEHGKLPWASLFGDARRTAEEGFIVSPRLARMVRSRAPQGRAPDAAAYFAQGPGGRTVEAGDRLVNKPYADFLSRLADQGVAAFYGGSTAARMVERTRAAPLSGSMTTADLASYRAVKREALCRPWRIYLLCAPPPPSSGVGLIQLMLMLEQTDIAGRGPQDPQAWFLFA